MNPQKNDKLEEALKLLREALPEWTQERAIHIFSGIEYLAFQNRGGKWSIKTGRCNWCGKCCQNLGDGKGFPHPVINGQCVHLKREPGKEEKWLCGLSLARPFGCSIGIADKQIIPDCTEDFEVLE